MAASISSREGLLKSNFRHNESMTNVVEELLKMDFTKHLYIFSTGRFHFPGEERKSIS